MIIEEIIRPNQTRHIKNDLKEYQIKFLNILLCIRGLCIN